MTILSLVVQSSLYKQSRIEGLIEHELPAQLAHLGAEVALELAPSLYLSRSLANNTFIERWIEKGMPETELASISNEMSLAFQQLNLASVFFVANDGNQMVYHHFAANLNTAEIIENHTEHTWYFDYLYSLKPYELNLDHNEFTSQQLQMFVNYSGNKFNRLGEPLIVAGVGLDMTQLAKLISNYRLGNQGRASLASEEGVVEVSSASSIITNLTATPETVFIKK
ncbi:MAG TPA: hypothetical protein VJY63_07205 [Marinospirillum sp.]|uniref:hypothetical protein n=1 Tax=Marinospirillum sp. TaxID=2183934 RepID=UPI002B497046|nr:hypothetical protein [Marinospirillum sp.]HKM15691.1 hypothetical protein [Marinospirillum sp.]